jgi:hypothetical protein
MELVREHPLLLGAVFLMLSVIWAHLALLSRVRRGMLTSSEARRLTLAIFCVLNGPLIAIAILAAAFGLQQPMCMQDQGADSPGRTVAVLLNIVWWVAILCWIWQDRMSGLVARALLRLPSQTLNATGDLPPRVRRTQWAVRITIGAIVAYVVATGIHGLASSNGPACSSISLLPSSTSLSVSVSGRGSVDK